MPEHATVAPTAPPAAARPRLGWHDLPAAVRDWTGRTMGGPVVEAHTQHGGFSPGVAARVRNANGERAFLKAVGAATNPDSPDLHRREAGVLAKVPKQAAIPELLGVYDDGDWVALLLRDVGGRQPVLPWQGDDLRLVAETVTDLSEVLTPCPAPGVGQAAVEFNHMLGLWSELAADPPGDLDPWLHQNLDRLVALAERPVELVGNSLLHLDLRADNLLITPDGQVCVVDWAHAATGPAWIDLVVLLLEVNAHGGLDVDEVVARHPLTRSVAPARITQVVLAMCGMFQERCRRPSPPGLPTIRGYQRAYAHATAGWLHLRFGARAGRW